jgi:glycosyltransferase involved in cell wall biosynthesis
MKGARFVIFPSELYENFPLTLCEAFACGVPVLASNIGAMQEIVANDETGIHFQAGNADDLAGKVLRAWTERDEMRRMGKRARIEFEDKYTAELNYSRLMEIYQSVLSEDTRVRLAFKAGQEMCTQTVNA